MLIYVPIADMFTAEIAALLEDYLLACNPIGPLCFDKPLLHNMVTGFS